MLFLIQENYFYACLTKQLDNQYLFILTTPCLPRPLNIFFCLFIQRTEQVNMMTREMNATPPDERPPVIPAMKPGVKLRKAIIELLDTEKTYVKVRTTSKCIKMFIPINFNPVDVMSRDEEFRNIKFFISG